MENNQNQNIDLPENAFRELKDGEEYKPVMSPQESYREVSPWSITGVSLWRSYSLLPLHILV